MQPRPYGTSTYSINIHAAHAGCDEDRSVSRITGRISIHAAHAGCDVPPRFGRPPELEFQSTQPMRAATHTAEEVKEKSPEFQSTQPMRAATAVTGCRNLIHGISIHAAHAGCDKGHAKLIDRRGNFNPRSPCGLRPPLSYF